MYVCNLSGNDVTMISGTVINNNNNNNNDSKNNKNECHMSFDSSVFLKSFILAFVIRIQAIYIMSDKTCAILVPDLIFSENPILGLKYFLKVFRTNIRIVINVFIQNMYSITFLEYQKCSDCFMSTLF